MDKNGIKQSEDYYNLKKKKEKIMWIRILCVNMDFKVTWIWVETGQKQKIDK